MDWKKIFNYMTIIAKIVSFVSLVLSVYIKVKTLIGTTKKKEETESDETESKETEEKSDEN